MDRHIDPMAIGILDSMVRVFIRLRIDLGVKSCFLQSSLDVVEVNPILDRENETARLAVELVASALGARIL